MIRHRFGGILRVARIGILRRRSSTHRRSAPGFRRYLSEGRLTPWQRHRATNDEQVPDVGRGPEDAPTVIDRGSRTICDEEEKHG
jgi:hypothetical protein